MEVPDFWPYVIVLGLVVLNGLFVAAEFAIVGAPRLAIERLAARGSVTARAVLRILRNPRQQDRFIATAQLGITVASLGLGMYGEHALAERLAHRLEWLGVGRWVGAHAIASTAAVGLLTYLHIVLGEMVPKSIALQYAERSSLWITPLMRWIQFLVLPVVIALNSFGNALLRVVGVRRQQATQEQYYTPEELQLIVEESEEKGAIRGESGRMLLELFEFGDLTAAGAMVPRVSVVGIPADAGPVELRDIVKASPHTRYPVYEQDLDHVVGMIHIKDVLLGLMNGLSVSSLSVRPLPVVPETALLDDVLAAIEREGAQMALVIDEHGGTAGTITVADLFEEVIGEIDESVTHVPDIREESAGRLRVLGTVRVNEVGERFDLDLEQGDVESISGLVLMLLGRPPRTGDVVEFGRLRLTVTAVRGRGVKEAIAEVIPET
ncbi:MAG TPA: hemolysin family protein [Vicinamibacterales bacterium]|nr:hemolysin family protein [Vicinamibacterales bacterium]